MSASADLQVIVQKCRHAFHEQPRGSAPAVSITSCICASWLNGLARDQVSRVFCACKPWKILHLLPILQEKAVSHHVLSTALLAASPCS